MSKCISCGKPNAEYKHADGGMVCNICIGKYFTCPDCGIVYDRDDFVNGDQGNGFCINCAQDH